LTALLSKYMSVYNDV